VLEHRGHRDGVELARIAGQVGGERAGHQLVARAGQRTDQGVIHAQPLAQRRAEGAEQRAVVAADIEHPSPWRDPSDDLADPAVTEIAIEGLHNGREDASICVTELAIEDDFGDTNRDDKPPSGRSVARRDGPARGERAATQSRVS
jgi:hypothetical protein